ncbi:unnamed protein product [Clonostachys chloroleuca]|uniref:Uncharacterized protein n=1 Tax=Clonostachys chloroleuca TaxID=1926264 RepID=A0AA35MIZ9_9HYPO|nr:unnamed protein product [Clonostachys chloroleuca]
MSDKAETSRSSRDTEDPVYDDIGSKTSKYDDTNEGNERLYVHRQPGDIYLDYLGGEYIPVLVLPFENVLEIGINGDLKTLNLVQFMPDCYIYDWPRENTGGKRGTSLGNFDLTDLVIMKQEYYQPLLRLIQQANVNRSTILANVVTEPGSQRPTSSGNVRDGTDIESCASPRADGKDTEPDDISKQGGDVEERPDDGFYSQTDRGENQDDDPLTLGAENIQNNGLSGTSGISSPSIRQRGNRLSELKKELRRAWIAPPDRWNGIVQVNNRLLKTHPYFLTMKQYKARP